MPLSEIKFVTRGNNNLLEGILNRQTVSLSDALNDAVQLTRDANNLQAGQERTALSEIRFDRSFREGKFRDRRDFSRRKFTEDRNFGEGVRQFNALDADRDADRGLRAELGRGSLALAGRRTALAEREGAGRIALNGLKLEDAKTIRGLREQAASPDLPQRSEAEQETLRRGGQAFGLPGVIQAVDSDGILPTRVRATDVAASNELFGNAEARIDTDIQEAEILASEAVVTAPENSPERARAVALLQIIGERKKELAAREEAALIGIQKGDGIAAKALKVFNDNKNSAFNPASTFDREAQSVISSKTRNAYIREGANDPVISNGLRSTPTAAQKDARAKKRGEFYDHVRATSADALKRAGKSQDPYGSHFNKITR